VPAWSVVWHAYTAPCSNRPAINRGSLCVKEKLGSLFCYGSRLRLFMTAIPKPIAGQDPSRPRSSPISLVPAVFPSSPHGNNEGRLLLKPTTLSCHHDAIIVYMIQVQRLDTSSESRYHEPSRIDSSCSLRIFSLENLFNAFFLESLQASLGLSFSIRSYSP
jgi:hypothetical protein